jgi:hypothetical protein
MNQARAQKLNKAIVDDYFNKLGTTLEKLNGPALSNIQGDLQGIMSPTE